MSLLKRIEQGGGGDGDGGNRRPAGGGGGGNPPNRPQRPRGVKQGGGSQQANQYADLKSRVQSRLLAELDGSIDPSQKDQIRQHIEELFNSILAEESMVLSRTERQRLFEAIVAEILGFGPIEILLADENVSEVMVNGPKDIFVERRGNLSRANIVFENNDHVMRIIDRIVAPLGRRVDESSPLCDARLPDGSRVNVVIPPIALNGPTVTIRKFSKDPLTIEDLIRFGSMTREIAEFLRACVISALNIVVSGVQGPARQRCSTYSRTSSPAMTASSPSRTRQNFNSSRNTLSRWKAARPTSRAKVKLAFVTSSLTASVCARSASLSASAVAAKHSTCSRP